MIKVLDSKMMKEAIEYTLNFIQDKRSLFSSCANAISANAKNISGKTLIIVTKGEESFIGLELAKNLRLEKCEVSVLIIEDLVNEDSINKITELIELNIPIYKYDIGISFYEYNSIVDCMFYFDKPIVEPYRTIIDRINNIGAYVLSVGMNSGMNSLNGNSDGALESDLTYAIGYLMPGHFLNDAKDVMKDVESINLGIPYHKESYYCFLEDDFLAKMKVRKNNSHKGTYGYTGIMGGSTKYSGASKLANMSMVSLISGAGVSRLIVPYEIADSCLPYMLESTLYPITSNYDGTFKFEKSEIDNAISGLTSLGFGMGIGYKMENKLIIDHLLRNFSGRLLLDADALNLLAEMYLEILNLSNSDIVLTPHIKEFSRLIKVPVNEILEDPLHFAIEFTKKYKVTLLLKGVSTIVSYKGKAYFIHSGSPSLSKGGSGDILSGVITGMMGYMNALDATLCGAYLFGIAGEVAANKTGIYSTLGRDVIETIKEIMKRL